MFHPSLLTISSLFINKVTNHQPSPLKVHTQPLSEVHRARTFWLSRRMLGESTWGFLTSPSMKTSMFRAGLETRYCLIIVYREVNKNAHACITHFVVFVNSEIRVFQKQRHSVHLIFRITHDMMRLHTLKCLIQCSYLVNGYTGFLSPMSSLVHSIHIKISILYGIQVFRVLF